MPSTLTWRSSIDSSSADCVFGEARLISSPTTMLAKMPPGLNSKSRVSWLNTETPVMSDGSRSGVNWIRRTEQAIERPRALASMVLPTPGHVLDEQVTLGQQHDQGEVDRAPLALDHALDRVPDLAHHLDHVAEGVGRPGSGLLARLMLGCPSRRPGDMCNTPTC